MGLSGLAIRVRFRCRCAVLMAIFRRMLLRDLKANVIHSCILEGARNPLDHSARWLWVSTEDDNA